VKRREGIGGVTIAVVGLVLALSVGIGATAHGRAFGNDKSTTGDAKRTTITTKKGPRTTTIWMETVVSQPVSSSSQSQGKCVANTRIVTTTTGPAAVKTDARRLRDISRGFGRGGRANGGIDT
jgi:hypothetical protein